MENRIKIDHTAGDQSGLIDDLIIFLQKCKEKGATHYEMRWSGHDMSGWEFKWFEAFKIKTEDEIKEEKIKDLEEQLLELKR